MTGFPIGMGMGGRQDSRGISICLSEESWLSFYLAIILHFPPQERLLSISILSHRDPRPSGSPKISYPTIQYDRIDQHAPENSARSFSVVRGRWKLLLLQKIAIIMSTSCSATNTHNKCGKRTWSSKRTSHVSSNANSNNISNTSTNNDGDCFFDT